MPILKKFAKLKKKKRKKNQKQNRDGVAFGKVVGLQHTNLLKRSPKMSVFLEMIEIIFR